MVPCRDRTGHPREDRWSARSGAARDMSRPGFPSVHTGGEIPGPAGGERATVRSFFLLNPFPTRELGPTRRRVVDGYGDSAKGPRRDGEIAELGHEARDIVEVTDHLRVLRPEVHRGGGGCRTEN